MFYQTNVLYFFFLDRDLLQNMTYNQFYNNQEGAIFATTAGEVNPWLTVAWSRMEHNGRFLYGNITTSQAAANMDLQNMRTLYFKVSNFIIMGAKTRR